MPTIKLPVLNSAPGGSSTRGPHRLAAVAECPRKWLLRYFHGIVYKYDPDFRLIGTLSHLCLAYMYAGMLKEPPAWFHERTLEEQLAIDGKGRPQEIRTAQEIFNGIKSRVLGYPWLPLAVETEFSAKLGDLLSKEQRAGLVVQDRPLLEEVITARVDLVVLVNGQIRPVDHKCLPASAEVSTPTGAVRLGTIKTPWDCIAWRESARDLVVGKASAPIPAGVQDVYAVTTAAGRSARFGFRHPVLTKRGWREVRDLRPGDKIAVALAGPDRPDVSFSDAELTAVGLVLADGSVDRGGAFRYGKTDIDTLTMFRKSLEALGMTFDRSASVDQRFFPVPGSSKPGGFEAYYGAGSTPAGRLFTRLQLSGKKAAAKRIPSLLRRVSKRQARLLIGALWTGDGAMYVPPTGSARIVYGSRSRALACDLRDLLCFIGIPATMTKSSGKYRGERRAYYFTTVVGRVGKRRFLQAVLSGDIPVVGYKRAGAEALLDVVESRSGGKSPDPDGLIWWDRVTSNICVGREPCFDISVDEFHTFVVNGFITHNCTVPRTRGGRLDAWRDGGEYKLHWQSMIIMHLLRKHYQQDVGAMLIHRIKRTVPYDCDYNPVGLPRLAYEDAPLTALHSVKREIEMEAMAQRGEKVPAHFWSCFGKYGPCDNLALCEADTLQQRMVVLAEDYTRREP